MRALKTGDYIALGLTALVIAGVYTQRAEAKEAVKPQIEPPPNPTPPTPPDLNDPNLQAALKLISDIENNPAIPPAQAAGILDQAAAVPGLSPQVAAVLKAAADKQRARLSPTPPEPKPAPTPGPITDPLLVKYQQLMAQGQTAPDTVDDAKLGEMYATASALGAAGHTGQMAMLTKLATDIQIARRLPK